MNTWKLYNAPENTISIALSDKTIYASTNDKLYKTGILSTANTLNWTEMATPEGGYISKINFNLNLFLLKNNTLYKYQDTAKWTPELQQANIINFVTSPDYYENILAWSNDYIHLKKNGVWTKKPFTGVLTAALDLHNLFIFTNDYKVYKGTNLNDLTFFVQLDDLHFNEACYNGDDYAIAGNSTEFASYYKSSDWQYFKYTHILTNGLLQTCASIKNVIYMGGVLNETNGIVFNADNLVETSYFNSAVMQLRTNKEMNKLVALHINNTLSVCDFL